MDYYSKRIATCSSDRTVKIFSVDDPRQATATLTGTFFFCFFSRRLNIMKVRFSLEQYIKQHINSRASRSNINRSHGTRLASLMVTSEIRCTSCFVLLRQESDHLQGRSVYGTMGKDSRGYASYFVCELGVLGTSSIRTLSCMCKFRRNGFGAYVLAIGKQMGCFLDRSRQYEL